MYCCRFIFIAAAVFCSVLAGCTREIIETVPEELGQQLRISIGRDFTTKSSVTNSGASQHIEHMYLYVFDGVTPESRCFYAADMGWKPVEGTGIKDFTYRIKGAGLDTYGNTVLTFLVVAVDNHPETYNFPFDDVSCADVQTAVGRTMQDVKASLASTAAGVDGSTGTLADKAYAMAHTELFSGVTSAPASSQTVSVTVERCVAGILCYLTDIPYNVVSGEDSKIESIALRLNTSMQLNSAVSLPVDDTSVPEGSGPIDGSQGVVIASADLSAYKEHQSDEGEEKELLYIPPVNDGTVVTLENSVLFGAYMIPVSVAGEDEGAPDDATLKIVLRGGLMPDGINYYERSYNVRNTADANDGTGTDHGVPVDGRDYKYSIQANRMYAIGSKPRSGDTDGDKPMSLSGNLLEIDVQDWVDVPDSTPEDGGNDADVQFPAFSLTAAFQTDITPEDIFDCIGDTITVRILPAAGGEEWTLGFDAVDGSLPEWISYQIGDAEGTNYGEWTGAPQSYTRTEGTDEVVSLRILLNDHVVRNYIMGDNSLSMEQKIEALQNDYRTAVLTLTTASDAASRKTLTINQYNAITAPVYDDEGEYKAFARYDLLNPAYDDVSYGYDGYSFTGWGFGTTYYDYIFGHWDGNNNDGEKNCTDAYEYAHEGISGNLDNYMGSALYRGRKEWTVFEDGKDTNPERYWFTPTTDELRGFFENVVGPVRSYYGSTMSGQRIPVVNIMFDKVNIDNGEHKCYYWSSSTYIGLPRRESYGSWIDGSGVHTDHLDRDGVRAFIRQARRFE